MGAMLEARWAVEAAVELARVVADRVVRDIVVCTIEEGKAEVVS